MSVIGGPNAVNDGLVLHLDAGNPKSFRGESTTNNLYTWMDGTFTSWSDWADGGGSGSYELLTDYPYGYKVRFSNTANTGRYSLSTGEASSPNAKRTFSIYVKPISWNDSNSRLHIYCDYGGGNGPYYAVGILFYLNNKTVTPYNYVENTFSYPVGDGWYRIGFTTTFIDATSGGIYPLLYDNSVVELAHPQLEIKDYATPFVDGTRGETFATNGGWIDLSGNNNHGATSNVPTFNSANRGSIVCDNINQQIYIPTTDSINFNNNSSFSMCIWFKKISDPVAGNTFGVFCKNGDPINYYGMDYYFGAGAIRFGIRNSTDGQRSYEVSATLLNWTYCVFTYAPNSINGMKLYLNGDIKSSVSNIGFSDFSSTGNYYICGPRALGGSPQYVNAEVSEATIYNKELSQSEISQAYNASKGRFGLT